MRARLATVAAKVNRYPSLLRTFGEIVFVVVLFSWLLLSSLPIHDYRALAIISVAFALLIGSKVFKLVVILRLADRPKVVVEQPRSGGFGEIALLWRIRGVMLLVLAAIIALFGWMAWNFVAEGAWVPAAACGVLLVSFVAAAILEMVNAIRASRRAG